MIQRDVVVGHPEGVHALVAHALARLASRYSSSIFLRTPDRRASLRSVVDVLEHVRAQPGEGVGRPVHLVGNSLGGLVSLLVAARSPDLAAMSSTSRSASVLLCL